MAYYEVKVAYQTEDAKGNIKTKKETLLVEALSVTDSEAQVVKHLQTVGETRQYEVVGSQESKISELVLNAYEVKSRKTEEAPFEDDETPI